MFWAIAGLAFNVFLICLVFRRSHGWIVVWMAPNGEAQTRKFSARKQQDAWTWAAEVDGVVVGTDGEKDVDFLKVRKVQT